VNASEEEGAIDMLKEREQWILASDDSLALQRKSHSSTVAE
jgi:hypothetical protein